jgi:hypothetical protein
MGHLDQPVAELPGGDAGDGPPERPAASAARGTVPCLLASFRAGLGEVKVLDHDRAGAVRPGGGEPASEGSRHQPFC